MTLFQGVLGGAAEIIWGITVKSAAAYCETPQAFPCLNQAPRQPRRRDRLTGKAALPERAFGGRLRVDCSFRIHWPLVGPAALPTVKCCPGRPWRLRG